MPSSNQATPITLANTRQIGVKRTIELTKGASGLGIGLTSRDVLTDNKSHPIYIKSIHPGGAAFQDGRLKLGDRLLSINGMDIQVPRLSAIVKQCLLLYFDLVIFSIEGCTLFNFAYS